MQKYEITLTDYDETKDEFTRYTKVGEAKNMFQALGFVLLDAPASVLTYGTCSITIRDLSMPIDEREDENEDE